MLPIRQNLLTLTCLKSTSKTMLVEVCELAENGGKGSCFASNATLARNLGISPATAVRKIAELEKAGLLTSVVVKAEANRRYLRPTAAVRACYLGGSKAEQLAAANNLTIVKNAAATTLAIVKTDNDYSQNSEVTIVKTDNDYSQNASRVIGDDQYDQKTTRDEGVALRAELTRAQKKIGELEGLLAARTSELVALKNQVPASHTRGGAAMGPYVPPAAENDEYYGRPRDVEMIDAFLANNHDPRLKQHAGKGYLFWAEYEGKAVNGQWVRNNGSVITNWRAVILSFGFREPPKAVGGSGNPIEDRLKVAQESVNLNRYDENGMRIK
jgi:DNA-binding MarR family transcriptional regulator